jgi:creatinine amidohydrolase
MTHSFAELTSPEVQAAVEAGSMVLLPVGQTEEHGPHLPVATDTIIASRLSAAAAERLEGEIPTLVLPPISYGFSGRVMKKWAGTFCLSMETIIAVVREVCQSLADMGFRKIVIINGHGNHVGPMRVVVRQLADSHRIDVPAVSPAGMIEKKLAEIGKGGPGGSCHAGECETSLMLHLCPELVDMSKATDEDVLHLEGDFSSSEVFWSTWSRQASRTGVYGNPTVATAETGRQLFEAFVDRLVEFLRVYYKHELSEGS